MAGHGWCKGGPGMIMDDGVLDTDWLIRLTYGPPARPARRHSEIAVNRRGLARFGMSATRSLATATTHTDEDAQIVSRQGRSKARWDAATAATAPTCPIATVMANAGD
ncbi:hypothetical protein V493_06537 [Pseudogymnoascus sp. VKM F-4281 (FW-2241)]|nr:hypothetical protein V493_06537 [Pseudogymnoascus sp. VKM F-4281 (FW-2241)]